MKTIDDINLSAKDRAAIEEASKLLKENFDIVEIRLFGSKARGTDEKESDIDLLILINHEVSFNEKNSISDSLFDLQLKYNVVFSFIALSKSNWNDGVFTELPIYENIKKEGVAV